MMYPSNLQKISGFYYAHQPINDNVNTGNAIKNFDGGGLKVMQALSEKQ